MPSYPALLPSYLFLYCSTVSRFHKIGCFNYKKNVIPALPRDPQIQSAESPVLKCAELAQEKGYRFFALGLNGKCHSGPEAGKQYFKYGSANKCKNGVGNKGAALVYTFGKYAVNIN